MNIDTAQPITPEAQPDVYDKMLDAVHLFGRWWKIKNILSLESTTIKNYFDSTEELDEIVVKNFMAFLKQQK